MGKAEVRLIRRPDWETRLVSFIESRQSSAFRWGEHDCCLFACDAIEAMTGLDPAEWFRGRYSDRHGATRCLQEFCGGDLEDAMASIAASLSAPEIVPSLARRGDALLVRQKSGLASFGICMGDTAAVARIPSGVALLPLEGVVRAWRVG